MKVEYAKRAVRDLEDIAAFYAGSDTPAAAANVAARIREVVARVAKFPQSGRPVGERPGVRVAALLHYPYLVFYAVGDDAVRIVHVRHTARQPWSGG